MLRLGFDCMVSWLWVVAVVLWLAVVCVCFIVDCVVGLLFGGGCFGVFFWLTGLVSCDGLFWLVGVRVVFS